MPMKNFLQAKALLLPFLIIRKKKNKVFLTDKEVYNEEKTC